MTGIVIVGAGQAGAALAAKIRTEGYTGPLTLIGEEHAPPYQRPPLSKGYLLGEMALERLYLRPEAWYAENGITLRRDTVVTAIGRADRTVIAGGQALPYERLALTTGSVPRRLPPAIGGTLGGVHVVRTLADVDGLAPAMQPGARLLVVGGGYIGLEAAAVAARLGLSVTLVEMADRILARVACAETAAWFRDLHAAHGVEILEGTGLEALTGTGTGSTGRVAGARLTDGTERAVDLVIAGVGITPATELAAAAGLAIDNGIAVDTAGRTSDPCIWAAGDCASFPWRGRRLRLESVQNAIEQAESAARSMLGAEERYDPVPWFWSDQFDVKLQIAGLGAGHDRIVARPGDKPGSRSHWYYAGQTLLAVDAMNDPRAYMVGKRLLEAGSSPCPEAIADPETALKQLLG